MTEPVVLGVNQRLGCCDRPDDGHQVLVGSRAVLGKSHSASEAHWQFALDRQEPLKQVTELASLRLAQPFALTVGGMPCEPMTTGYDLPALNLRAVVDDANCVLGRVGVIADQSTQLKRMLDEKVRIPPVVRG